MERVPSDHPSVDTHRTRVVRTGGTRRPALCLPAPVAVDPGDLIRVVLAGDERHARVAGGDDGPVLPAAYDNRRLARNPDEPVPGASGPDRATNRLVGWLDRHGHDAGSSVELDVLDSQSLYGVRDPGSRVVYEVTEAPPDSLSSIAERLGDRSE